MNNVSRLPAEWEPQSALWLTWPQNEETWRGHLPQIEKVYARIIESILNHQEVNLLVNDSLSIGSIGEKLNTSTKPHLIHFTPFATNDCWIRDYGGVATVGSDGVKKMLNWHYNAWGEKYFPWELDNMVPIIMARRHGLELVDVPVVLEGGSIDSNGAGLLLTTDTCLLNPNRNPSLSRADIEKVLTQHLGASHIIWLSGELAGDDTDGHVDEVARFVSPSLVFHAVEEDRNDANYQTLKKMAKQLEARAAELNLDLVEVPLPDPLYFNDFRAPASYLNFLMVNGAVLVPSYGGPKDEKVFPIFERYFPSRKIYPIDSGILNYGQGGVHCISMQVPD